MKHCLNKRDHHETSFDEQEDLPKKLQTRNKGQFQKLTDSTNAWWWPLINDDDAWSLREITADTRHYDNEIDPRDFEGTSPKFSWE